MMGEAAFFVSSQKPKGKNIMSDETLDGGSPNGGTPTSPNAGGSQGQSVSDGSGDAQKLQAALDNLTKRLDEVDKRSRVLQSDKDRSVSQTKKDVEELKRKFAEVEKLKAKGYNDDDAFEELELRESIRVIREQLSNTDKAQTGNAGNGNGSAVDRARTLQQYGLSENDPDVAAELNGKAFASEIELENAALKIAFKRANRPQPDASAAPVAQGTPVTVGSNAESVARLEKLQQDPIRNRKEIAEIEKALGW